MNDKKFSIGEVVVCAETFTATHTNAGGVKNAKEFTQGYFYKVESTRPEGAYIDGFFVFNKNFDKFERLFS